MRDISENRQMKTKAKKKKFIKEREGKKVREKSEENEEEKWI